MRLSSRPQTEIRKVAKIFRLLYPLEDRLNEYIQGHVISPQKLGAIQIFFDTDLPDDSKVNLLKLRDNILQVETSLNWTEFSALEWKEQKRFFIRKLNYVVNEVAKKYSLDIKQIECAFKFLLEEIDSPIK